MTKLDIVIYALTVEVSHCQKQINLALNNEQYENINPWDNQRKKMIEYVALLEEVKKEMEGRK